MHALCSTPHAAEAQLARPVPSLNPYVRTLRFLRLSWLLDKGAALVWPKTPPTAQLRLRSCACPLVPRACAPGSCSSSVAREWRPKLAL